MKWCTFFIALFIFTSARGEPASPSDTFDLIGGTAGLQGLGWNGEGWRDTAWCGDPVKWDTTRTITPILMDTNITYDTQTVITIDSVKCSISDFQTDTGGFYPNSAYINYYYKFRNYWAQLPLMWMNWQGYDSLKTNGSDTIPITSYKYFMIVYQGLLPVHQASLSFFYGTWGMDSATKADDSIKNTKGAGDGLLTLYPSPTWKTVIIKIPDSVSLARITGLTIAIGNQAKKGDSTSAVGNFKLARVALLSNADVPIQYRTNPQKIINNRFIFTPTGENVTITAYSLKGETIFSKKMMVHAGKHYSIGQFVRHATGLSAAQVRLIKINGEGVNITTRIW